MDEVKRKTRKTDQERIDELNEKIKKLQAQQKALAAKESARLRKERTHRLIANGALAEKYLNCENMPAEAFEEKLKYIVSLGEVKNFIAKNSGQ